MIRLLATLTSGLSPLCCRLRGPVYPSESYSCLSNLRDKFVTRRELLARRNGVSPDRREAASHRIAERVRVVLADHGMFGSTIALYAAKGSEVDTGTIDSEVRKAGGHVAYPRVVDRTLELTFHRVTPDELIGGSFGLREPRPDSKTRVPLTDIGAYIVPGIAFDKDGWRIGWGRGHYDATLSLSSERALRLGIAFECQIIRHVPHEPHDARLQFVITELATYKAV